MKKLILVLAVLFSGSVLAENKSVGFSEFSECPSGYKVFFDRTQLDLSRGEYLTVSVCEDILTLFDHRVTRENNTVFLDVSYGTNSFSVPIAVTTYSIPIYLYPYSALSNNDVTVVVRFYKSVGRLHGPHNFEHAKNEQYAQVIKLVPPSRGLIVKDPSGTWYQPSLSGTGFVVMQYENGTVVQYYGYDADGGRLWLLSDVLDKAWVKGEAQTLTMYEGKADSTTGFTKPPADAPGIEEWGKLELQFDSCSKATATLKGTDGEQTFDLQPLAKPSAVHCY